MSRAHELKGVIGIVVSAAIVVTLPMLGTSAAATTCPAADSTHFVVTSNADNGAGSLRSAIADASGAGVRSTICTESTVGSIHLSSSLHATDAGDQLDILGNGTTIVGNDTFGLFVFEGPVTIDDLTMSGGHAAAGGAIDAHGGLELSNSRLEDNVADGDGGAVRVRAILLSTATDFAHNSAGGQGGAVAASDQVEVYGGTFSDNNADSGGAIHAAQPVFVSTGTFARNHAIDGGAIASESGISALFATFDHNSADGGLGGATLGGSSGFIGTTFVGNSARSGGAVWSSSALAVGNSTFVDNEATDGPGGVAIATTVAAAYTTITGNRASQPGSAFFVTSRGSALFGSVMIAPTASTVLCAGAFSSSGYNYANETANSCNLTAVGDSSLDSNDAGLSELADHGGPTATELPGQSLIDRIPPGACHDTPPEIQYGFETDQRGLSRPEQVDGSCDIGAVEIQLPPVSLPPPILLAPRFTG